MDIDARLIQHVVEVGAGAWASKETVAKILGPTADYLGSEIKQFAEKCNINLSQIFTSAKRKLGERLDDAGQVNPRVLKGIISEGGFAEDEVAAEYFGGVLAASRSESGSDDRGVAFLGLIRDLSTYQLRFHYLVYSWIHELFLNSGLRLGLPRDRQRVKLFIPTEIFDICVGGATDVNIPLRDHCVMGIARHALIEQTYSYGSREYLIAAWPKAPGSGIILSPSQYGAELFLWAHGWGNKSVNELLLPSLTLSNPSPVTVPDGVVAIVDEKARVRIASEVQKFSENVQQFAGRVDAALKEGAVPPALPHDLKANAEYVIAEIQRHIDFRAEATLNPYLEHYLYPPEDSSLDSRLDSLRSLASMCLTYVSEER